MSAKHVLNERIDENERNKERKLSEKLLVGVCERENAKSKNKSEQEEMKNHLIHLH